MILALIDIVIVFSRPY